MKIFTLVFSLIISFAAFWYGIKMLKLYRRVKKWDRVKATVTKKSVVKRERSAASRALYKPTVDYSYNYSSKTYTGNKIFLAELIKGERGFMHHAAEKFLEKINAEVEIYVNPEAPEDSVIYTDGIVLYFVVLLMGLLSLLIGLTNYLS